MHCRHALLLLSLALERDEHGDCVARGDVLGVLDLAVVLKHPLKEVLAHQVLRLRVLLGHI